MNNGQDHGDPLDVTIALVLIFSAVTFPVWVCLLALVLRMF